MKSFYYFVFVLALNGSVKLSAQVIGSVLDEKEQPLGLVNVYYAGTTIGTVTDSLGIYTLPEQDTLYMVVASIIGYEKDTIDLRKEVFVFKLKTSTIHEVTIVGEKDASTFSQLNPQLVETLNEREFIKAACCNLSESFSTNATVDVNYSDAVTGAKSIQMLGLDGRYVQLTTELLPSIRGLASPFGLNYIPGTWMESLQISKGAGSVVNGYEAVTGQINLELRKPYNASRLYLNAYVNHMGRIEANANISFRIGPRWSNITLLHGDYFNTIADDNNDGFLDLPLIKTGSFVHR